MLQEKNERITQTLKASRTNTFGISKQNFSVTTEEPLIIPE